MKQPASIRYSNPGAMWGGNAIARKWGALGNIKLDDGFVSQNNHIALFPDKVHGAAAQFDLWHHAYAGLTLENAIRKWSGGNSSETYMHFLCERTGLEPSSIVSQNMLAGPTGLKLMQAQAHWEAGRDYPLSDAEWAEAQKMVFGI